MTVTRFTPPRSGHNKMNLQFIIALVVTTWVGFARSDGCSSCPIDGDHDHCDDVYNPPPRIQIDPGMCDKISNLPTEQTKLCKKYEEHPGYYVSCSSRGMTFSCKASCGVKVEDVGKNFTINDKLKDIMSNGLLLGLNAPHEKHEDLLSGVGFGGDLLSFDNHPAMPEHTNPNPPKEVQANNAGHANPFNHNLVPQGAYDVYQPLIIPNQQNQQQPHTNFNFNPLPQPSHSFHNPFPSGPSNFPGSPFFPSNVQHPAAAVPVQHPAPAFPSNVQHPAPAVPVQHPAPAFPSHVQHPAPAVPVQHPAPAFPSHVQHPAPAVPVQHPAPAFPSHVQHPAPAVPVQHPAPAFPSHVQHPAPAVPVQHPAPAFPSHVQHPAPAVPVQHPAPAFSSNVHQPSPAGPAVSVQHPAPAFPGNVQHPAPALPVQRPGSPNNPQPIVTPPLRGPGSPFLPADLSIGYQPAPKTGDNAPKPIPTPPPRGPGSPFLPTDLNTLYQPAPQAVDNVPQASPTPPPHGPGSPFLPTDLNTGYQPAPQAGDNVPQASPTPPPYGPGSPFLPTDLNTGYQPASQASNNVPKSGANVPQSGANVPQPSPTPPPHGPGSPFLPTDLNTGYQPASRASDSVPKPGANVPQPTTSQPRSSPVSPFLPTDLITGYHPAPKANADVLKSTFTTFSPSQSSPVSQFLATDLEAESAIPKDPTPQPPKVNPVVVNPAHQSDAGSDDDVVLSHPAPVAPAKAVVNDPHVYEPNAQTGLLPTVLANKASIHGNTRLPGENHADPQSHVSKSVHGKPLNTLPTHVISNPASSLPDPQNVQQHTVNNSPADILKSSLPAVSNPSGPASYPVSGADSHSNFGPLVSTHVGPGNAGGSYTGFAGFAPFPGRSSFHNNAVAHPAPQVPSLPDLRLPNVPAYNSIHGNARHQNPPARADPKSGGDPFFGFGFGTYGGNNGYQNLGVFNNNYGSTNNHLGQLTDNLHKQMNDLKDTSASGTSSSTNTDKTSSSSKINSYNTGSSNAGSTSGGSSTHDLGANNNAGHGMTNGNDLFAGFGNMLSGQGGSKSGNHGNGPIANPDSHTMFNQLSNHQGYFQGFQPFHFMAPPKTGNEHRPASKNNIFSNGLFDFMGRRR